jgi:putative ABC transport system permease protein
VTTPRMYRMLLRLLPGELRRVYGHQMASVFQDLSEETRDHDGWAAVVVLWAREIVGLLKFSFVLIDEALAKHFWPQGAVGHTFRISARSSSKIVGVVGHVRTQEDGWTGPSQRTFLSYTQRPRLPPPTPNVAGSAPAVRNSGGSYGFIALTVRLDSPARAAELFRNARAIVPQFSLKGELVDDEYASWADDTLLITRIVTGFGVLAFVVAMAGIYGVMAFLVAGRTREIGIRMALGADRRAINRLVLGSSVRLVLLGAGLGVLGALGTSRWVKSKLFGVSPTDPVTFVSVVLIVIAVSLIATWHPASQAGSVDPAITLRAE